jgi:hypothetical protein
MILCGKKNISGLVVTLIHQGPMTSLGLIEEIRKVKKSITKQAVYSALRELQAEEIVILHKGIVSLHTDWIKKLHEFALEAERGYFKTVLIPGYFTNLAEGEKVEYHFKAPAILDSAWGHILITLNEIIPVEYSFYAYNPHYWFMFARPESENYFLEQYRKKGRFFYLTVGSSAKIDKILPGGYDNELIQYKAISQPLSKKNNYYLNVINDFVVEVLLDKDTSIKIDRFYGHYSKLTKSNIEEFRSIINTKGRNRITISRNIKKAEKWKKKLKKDFYIPKGKL